MFDKELIGSKGIRIVEIDFGEDNDKYRTLSEFDENWEIHSVCPACNEDIYFNKHNINKLITCKCGQKLQVQIPEKLL